MDATTALLVDGAFVLLGDGLDTDQKRDVVNSVLLARKLTAKRRAPDADGYARAFHDVLANVGWISTKINKVAKHVDPATGDARSPLELIAAELGDTLPDDLLGALVAGVAGLADARPAVREAWQTTTSDENACASLLIVATPANGVPMLVYDYNELSPALIAGEYPWSALTGPGTLTQLYGSVALNPAVFTARLSEELAAKVAPLRPAAVVPIQPL